ncbi:hypothetical protein TBLA_0G02550 [Henningerozyma blattae CBS 6284]|uniref:Major facilitator superfamily (MFS) profile domain-containing protein n=1 Tax=Henningerozyma blattae (strain ATCC 34711 / CBS 6284 / DSM 70876 / NBRC 10599 / NRRL Y-10934 / UCD 77-7) TaxID=1071380 RepID=I2H741_HENB6|nr:hypothetical protein TBLA_0G02550 [Tetrapisispora blattae CBS 6284]CCH62193.1 hypothetical protein TBLA_0G02550 [Tetrapisispora blattae CBS 6284]
MAESITSSQSFNSLNTQPPIPLTNQRDSDDDKKYDPDYIPNQDGTYYLKGTLSHTTTRELHSDDSSIDTSLDGELSTPDEEAQEHTPPHSMLSYWNKWGMVAVLTMCGFWSSLGSPIYYPALKQLEKKFNVDENLVNVSVVVYLIFQGFAPAVSGGLADIYGRRPVILFGMLVYVVASIGIAACNSYGVIIFLRCLQSTGISPLIAISSGAVGDFTVKAERGTFVGAVSGLVLMGQAFGSLIGAALAAAYNWRAIFWFLAIGCGACMAIAGIVLPETKRTLVGNLSVTPKRIINRAPILYLKPVKKRFKLDSPDYNTIDPNIPKLDLTSAIKITAQLEIFLSLFPGGLQFALWTLMLTSISGQLSAAPYNYKLIIVGLCYLPGGIGGLLGSLLTGRIIDVFYKKSLKKFEDDKAAGLIPQEEEFNIFRARLIAALPQNFLAVISFLLFGWSVDKKWNIAAVCVTSFVSSYCAMSTLSTSSTLLVDLYPGKSSTATSCFNLIRCSLSALFMGCFADMKEAMTIGGVFSFLCGLILLGNFLVFIPMKYGTKWRRERLNKAEAKRLEKLRKNGDLESIQDYSNLKENMESNQLSDITSNTSNQTITERESITSLKK